VLNAKLHKKEAEINAALQRFQPLLFLTNSLTSY